MEFAFWKKCDFQIHTPRDPNWVGERPFGVGDIIPETGVAASQADVALVRKGWAGSFVDQCIAKGLGAIAITDHHEMTMVPYVQAEIAARKETDSKFDLWLFPGMELTASNGKQCLILFDSDLSGDWLRQAQGKLGIVYANLDENSAQGPAVTQLTCNYADIGKHLDEIQDLRGRYIVLPNISQGNNHTVLIDQAHADFKRMPYVGGYLDTGQTINTLSNRNRRRISGNDDTWSLREIYPLPTSDSRSADFASLANNNTWIKFSEPTAEAIRQAFLGHQSRIRIEPPCIPALFVSHISIDGSSILLPTKMRLSPEFNSIIGGRGSGKSSFLEYISFGLGRSCYDLKREHYSNTSRMHDLINDTLVSKNASITLTIVQDNAVFIVVRSAANSYQPQITYPNGDQQAVTIKELRTLFPAVVYSQGELAEIGKQTGTKTQLTDLLQFVSPDYKREDDKFGQDIEAAKIDVKKAIQKLTENWALKAKHRQLTTERDSNLQRVEALEKTLPDLSDEDKATVALFDKANEFDSKRLQASKHTSLIVSELQAMTTELLSERDLSADLTTNEIALIQERYRTLYSTFKTGVQQLIKQTNEDRTGLAEAEDAWSTKILEARTNRDGVLEKLGAHKTVTGQIIKLRERITELTNQIGDLQTSLNAFGDPSAGLVSAIEKLQEENTQRATRTQEWALEIERLSSGKIKAVVDPEGDISELGDAIDLVANKTGSQEATRRAKLEEALVSEIVSDVRDRLRTDCLSLLYWRLLGAAGGEDQPSCPNLIGMLGDTQRIRVALTENMDTARVEAMATAVSKPEITLTYCDGTREISFEKASEGQRAAALLFMLLEQPGGPLIIDQPEGDLDNKIITDLTEKLHLAKQNRQIIFASHNANIVVNGSSELVGHLDIDDEGERRFECIGAIDKLEVCKVITSTVEGGEKAFKDRQQKYGY